MTRFLSVVTVFILLCATIPFASRAAALDVRLDTSTGVARFMVDGKPVAPRMLRGGKMASPVVLGTGPAEYVCRFTCTGDPKGQGTLHFKLEERELDLVFDNMKMVEVETGRVVMGPYDFEDPKSALEHWRIHPPQKTNKAGTLRACPDKGKDHSGGMELVTRKPDEGWPQFFLIEHERNLDLKPGKEYVFTFWARSSAVTRPDVNVYIPGHPYTPIGRVGLAGADPFTREIRQAASAGTNLVATDIAFPWPKPGEAPDYATVDEQMRHILNANANALVVPWFCLDPPIWWLDAHKDHEQKLLGSRPNIPYNKRSVSVSSALYRREACLHLKNCIAYMEKKYGDHILGYMPCGQNSYEWFYQGIWGGGYPGYAPIDRTAWNEWLKEKYGSDEALGKAWRTDRYKLGNVEVPSLDFRVGSKKDMFLDVATKPEYRYLLDFHIFLQKMMSGTVLAAARTAKEASGKLVFIFYGYYFELGGFAQGAATTGHIDMRTLLDSPWIDVFCAPMSYFDRYKGGSAPAMAACESVALAGKMWLNEDDTRTHLIPPKQPSSIYGDKLENLADTQQIHRRNLGQYVTRNFGSWWVDLGRCGWLDEPGIWSSMKELRPLDEYFVRHAKRFQPEIAAFVDTDSLLCLTDGVKFAGLTNHARAAFGLTGAPYGQYLLDDYLGGRTSAKLNVLLTAWRLSKEQRAVLRKKAETDTIVWCYGSGWLDKESGGAPGNMAGAMPFTFKKIANPKKPLILTDAGKDFGLKLLYTYGDMARGHAARLGMKQDGLAQSLVYNVPDEVFTVTDAKPEEVLAKFADGSPAIVLRHMSAGGHSMYVGVPSLDREILRGMARLAGVHLYVKSGNCVLYANAGTIVLHGAQTASTIELDTGSSGEVWDYTAQKSLGHGPILKLPIEWSETRILLIDPPAELVSPAQSGPTAR